MNVIELARDAGSIDSEETIATVAASVIKAHTEELIAGVGEPAHHIMSDGQCIGYYSATQVAGAVVIGKYALNADRYARERRIAELESTLKWLDRWMGHKPLAECAKKIKEVLHG